jgi:hypothetical protein
LRQGVPVPYDFGGKQMCMGIKERHMP